MIPAKQLFDDAAISNVYCRHAPALDRFFLHHIHNMHDAEDLTATTFSSVLASSMRYEERGRFDAWLWSIARHVLRDAQRRRAAIAIDAVAAYLHDPAPLPEHVALEEEQAETLRDLVAHLPADQRAALLLWGAQTGVGTMVDIAVMSLRQQIVPDSMLGRVTTVSRTVGFAAIPLSTLIGGVLVDQFGNVALMYSAIAMLSLLIALDFGFSVLGTE